MFQILSRTNRKCFLDTPIATAFTAFLFLSEALEIWASCHCTGESLQSWAGRGRKTALSRVAKTFLKTPVCVEADEETDLQRSSGIRDNRPPVPDNQFLCIVGINNLSMPKFLSGLSILYRTFIIRRIWSRRAQLHHFWSSSFIYWQVLAKTYIDLTWP